MSTSISGRTRTPPILKWLLNERAALAGQLQAASIHCQFWAAKIDKLQTRLDACGGNYQEASSVKATHQAALEALDVAIGLASKNVRPDAGGTVNAWAGKYGQRGALTEFVAATLMNALPAGVDVTTLVNLASKHFYVSVLSPQDRKSLRLSVKSALNILARGGRAIPPHIRTKSGIPGVWRWKQPTTLAELATRAATMREATDECDSNRRADANPAGCQVDAQ